MYENLFLLNVFMCAKVTLSLYPMLTPYFTFTVCAGRIASNYSLTELNTETQLLFMRAREDALLLVSQCLLFLVCGVFTNGKLAFAVLGMFVLILNSTIDRYLIVSEKSIQWLKLLIYTHTFIYFFPSEFAHGCYDAIHMMHECTTHTKLCRQQQKCV